MKRSPITRKTRIKPVNRARKAKRFQTDFGGAEYRDHIAAMPCAMCRIAGYSVPAHAKSRGAGGDASDLVPLCGIRPKSLTPWMPYAGCHHYYDNHAETHAEYKDELRARAKQIWSRWLARRAEGTQ